MYTLDTNAIIYFLKDDPQAVSILRDVFEQDVPVYISAITEVELFGFPKLTDQEAEQIEAMIGSLAVIPAQWTRALPARQDSFAATIVSTSPIVSLPPRHSLRAPRCSPVTSAIFAGFQAFLYMRFNSDRSASSPYTYKTMKIQVSV